MKNGKRFGSVVAAFVAVALVAVPAVASDATVGGFLMKIAEVKRLDAGNGAAAAASLKAAGIQLPALDLDRVLTERDVAAIANAAGLRITTTRPEAPFSMKQVDGFLASFGADLGAAGSGNATPRTHDNSGSNSSNGKGKKKGHNKTPSEPS